MTTKLLSLLAATALLAGCAPVTILSPLATVSPFRQEDGKNYTLDQPQSATVGEAVIKRKRYYVREVTLYDRAVPDRDFEATCNIPLNTEIRYRGVSGIEIPITGTTELEGKQYSIVLIGRTNNGIPAGLLIDSATRQATGQGVWRNGFGIWDTKGGASFDVSRPLPFFTTPTKTEIDKTKSFENIELVYTGLSGKGTIALLYREFTPEDMARPAFFQTLSYDISVSDVIAFKSFRIKVNRASNERLEYVVIQE